MPRSVSCLSGVELTSNTVLTRRLECHKCLIIASTAAVSPGPLAGLADGVLSVELPHHPRSGKCHPCNSHQAVV